MNTKICIVLLVSIFTVVFTDRIDRSGPKLDYIQADFDQIREDGLTGWLSNRIVGGNEALDGQFPYQAALILQNEDNSTALCGGSLIGMRWILAAAHCFSNKVSANIYLGAHNIIANYEVGRQIIPVTRDHFRIHPDWYSGSRQDDIALVKLPIDARISRDIKIIELPDKNDEKNTFAGTIATASGWGRPYDGASISPILRYVALNVTTNSDCQQMITIRSNHICTYDGHLYRSPCNGDSGGPLAYTDHNRQIVIGVTSYGSSAGCEKGYPAIFTRVTAYSDWIRETMLKID